MSIAALDAVLSPAPEYRYFSFDPRWAPGQRMASMRNGSGDAYFVVFSAEGTVARGFDHESELSPWARDDGKVAPGILDGFPAALGGVMGEPAFGSDGGPETDLTFCAWWLPGASSWETGPIEEDGGASELFEVVLEGTADSYAAYASEYFEIELPVHGVEGVFALSPIDGRAVAVLNQEADPPRVLAELAAIGYPVTQGGP